MKNGMQEQEQAHDTPFARYKVTLICEVIFFFFFFTVAINTSKVTKNSSEMHHSHTLKTKFKNTQSAANITNIKTL